MENPLARKFPDTFHHTSLSFADTADSHCTVYSYGQSSHNCRTPVAYVKVTEQGLMWSCRVQL